MSISLRLRVAGLAVTVVAVGLLSTSAFAQDWPPRRWEPPRNIPGAVYNTESGFSWYFGVQGGFLAGRADMTHPFGPAATDASISGGFVGIYGGTPCFFQLSMFVPGTCIRAEASINLSHISGISPPNFGGEVSEARIRSFATFNVQAVAPLGDSFSSRNMFYGGQVGARQDMRPLVFIGVGPAVGNTYVDFAGATTSDTRVGFNAQTGLIFPVAPNAAVRVGYSFLYLGAHPTPTAAGEAHVTFWAQGANLGLEFKY